MSDELRFKLVVANLPPSIVATVKDVIGTSKSFETLSKALQDRHAQFRAERIKSLLSQQQLGDQKPSALLRSMRSELAATGDVPLETELLSTLFYSDCHSLSAPPSPFCQPTAHWTSSLTPLTGTWKSAAQTHASPRSPPLYRLLRLQQRSHTPQLFQLRDWKSSWPPSSPRWSAWRPATGDSRTR